MGGLFIVDLLKKFSIQFPIIGMNIAGKFGSQQLLSGISGKSTHALVYVDQVSFGIYQIDSQRTLVIDFPEFLLVLTQCILNSAILLALLTDLLIPLIEFET